MDQINTGTPFFSRGLGRVASSVRIQKGVDELVARAYAVGFAHSVEHEEGDLLWFNVVLIDDVAAGLLEFRQVNGGSVRSTFLLVPGSSGGVQSMERSEIIQLKT